MHLGRERAKRLEIYQTLKERFLQAESCQSVIFTGNAFHGGGKPFFLLPLFLFGMNQTGLPMNWKPGPSRHISIVNWEEAA